MKNFQHKVRRFREFFTTKESLNLLSYLPFPSSNTKKDKSLSKLPRCSPHLAGPLKPSATLTSILRGLSSAPAPLFLRLSTIFTPPFLSRWKLLILKYTTEYRLGWDSTIHPRVYALEKSRIFVSFRREENKKKNSRWYERKEILFFGSPRQGETKRMGPNRENKITWERVICVFGFMCFLWTPHGSQTL